jgi:hypothetical protein
LLFFGRDGEWQSDGKVGFLATSGPMTGAGTVSASSLTGGAAVFRNGSRSLSGLPLNCGWASGVPSATTPFSSFLNRNSFKLIPRSAADCFTDTYCPSSRNRN